MRTFGQVVLAVGSSLLVFAIIDMIRTRQAAEPAQVAPVPGFDRV